MAKRRAAEPLTFRVPWKRLLLSDFPEQPPLWVSPSGSARPRKRQGDAGTMAEPAAAPRKRRGGGDGGQEPQGRGLEPGEPPPGEQEEPRVSRASGGGDGSAGSAADGAHIPPSEEFWEYNTFQYWRNPLPPIDVAALEDCFSMLVDINLFDNWLLMENDFVLCLQCCRHDENDYMDNCVCECVQAPRPFAMRSLCSSDYPTLFMREYTVILASNQSQSGYLRGIPEMLSLQDQPFGEEGHLAVVLVDEEHEVASRHSKRTVSLQDAFDC
ncbi:hypothetical protein STEG23_023168 [Scotinomys teguina]